MTPVGENAELLPHVAKVVGQDETSSGSSVVWIVAGQLAVAPTAAEHTVSETVSSQGRYIVMHMSCATFMPQVVPGVSVLTTFHTVCVPVPNTKRSRSRWQLKGVVGENDGKVTFVPAG